MKERIKHWLLDFLGIEYVQRYDTELDKPIIVNRLDKLDKFTGCGYTKWVRYGEYTGEKGSLEDRILNIEKELKEQKEVID